MMVRILGIDSKVGIQNEEVKKGRKAGNGRRWHEIEGKGWDGMGGKDGGWRMEGVRGVGWDKMEGVVRGQE